MKEGEPAKQRELIQMRTLSSERQVRRSAVFRSVWWDDLKLKLAVDP